MLGGLNLSEKVNSTGRAIVSPSNSTRLLGFGVRGLAIVVYARFRNWVAFHRAVQPIQQRFVDSRGAADFDVLSLTRFNLPFAFH